MKTMMEIGGDAGGDDDIRRRLESERDTGVWVCAAQAIARN